MNKDPAAGTVLSGQTPTVLFPDGLVGYLWVLEAVRSLNKTMCMYFCISRTFLTLFCVGGSTCLSNCIIY